MKNKYPCAYCGAAIIKYPSQVKGRKRVYCSPKHYYLFVAEKLPPEEQNAWKGGIDPRESSRMWKKKNKARAQAIVRARRLKEKNAEGKHTPKEWEEIKKKYNYTCAEADDTCSGQITKDHKIPIDMGGSNWPSNLQPLCRSHNSRKARKVHLGTFEVNASDV